MPLFSYQCNACGQGFDVLQPRLADATPQSCPSCGQGGAQRALSLPAKSRGSVDRRLPTRPACGEGPPCGAAGCSRLG
jgi:putative FmdB family regulatory protein